MAFFLFLLNEIPISDTLKLVRDRKGEIKALEKNQILSTSLEVARPYLLGRTIKRAVIGLSIVAVELDDGSLGSSYVLREELDGCVAIFQDNLRMLGMDAYEMASWAVNKKHVLKRALGIATLNSVTRRYFEQTDLLREDLQLDVFGLLKNEDTVGMVGYLGPVVKIIEEKGLTLHVFDKGHPTAGSVEELSRLPEVLPTCSVVFLSGTSLINNTIDELLALCTTAREIIIMGSTAVGYPEAYAGTRVSVVAGTLWRQEKAKDFFDIVSLAGGIKNLRSCMQKYAYRNEK